jgi:glutathionyl-hydroquinone reductase
MAGGWDGDALAGQMEDALERQQAAAEARQRRDNSSPEERAREAEAESLRLSKARILDQLNCATNPAHRAMLERALKSLEEQTGT